MNGQLCPRSQSAEGAFAIRPHECPLPLLPLKLSLPKLKPCPGFFVHTILNNIQPLTLSPPHLPFLDRNGLNPHFNKARCCTRIPAESFAPPVSSIGNLKTYPTKVPDYLTYRPP
ncbi:hypothetical protein VTJ04DRAFT_4011 [Mycothermus thermophilus]|uniref:uncharacterized protein n=1 Tax=Humicola insolens TaxID=85995 RepID=UPI003742CE0A